MRIYFSVKDAAKRLAIAERTVRTLASRYDWFGAPLGEDEEDECRPWVFTAEEVNRMAITPRPGPGRPRKRIA